MIGVSVRRLSALFLLTGVALTAVACASDDDAALAMAGTACTEALADATDDQDLSELVEIRSSAADLAAEAAELDPRWSDLVPAASGWQQTTRDLVEASENIDDLSMVTLSQMGDDVNEALRQMQTVCRQVRAAGGSVDTLEDLNN